MAVLAPHSPKVAASILSLAALAASPLAFCQPLFEPVARDARQAEIVNRIREEQITNGAYSATLVEPLMALSFLYQEDGDRRLAIAAIERALQVQRANYGLRTLDQAPLMLQMIRNAETIGNLKMAWELEQGLALLARKNPTDLRAVSVLREIGDKRMDLLARYAKGEEFLPQIILGCYYDPLPVDVSVEQQRDCYSGSRRVAIQAILRDAQQNYRDAIRVMQRNELYSSDELRDLEMELVRTTYLYALDGAVGKASLRRLLSYEVANDSAIETRVRALLQMADWDLLYANGRSENEAALAIYEGAYRELEKAGAQASIEEMFSPKTPVVIPAFLPNPLASEESPESGYIDVAFGIASDGESTGIEIVGGTHGVTDTAKKNLVRTIARSTFRPRFTAGRVVENTPVVVRYYLDN